MRNSTFLYILVPCFIIAIVFFTTIWQHKSVFQKKTDYQSLKHLYENSQYAPDPSNRREIIQDWDLYSYAGITYLTEGRLDEVNYEHPPLGKYLFGLFYLVCQNTVILQIILGLLLLVLIFQIGQRILGNTWITLLPPLLLSQEKLFIEQVTHSLLDLLQVTAICLFMLVATLKKQSGKHVVTLGVLLGIVAATKFPTVALLLGASYGVTLILKRNKHALKQFATVTTVGILFYLGTYLPLALTKGPDSIITTHIKALRFHLSHVPEYPPLAPTKVMFLNQWPVWFDIANPIHSVAEWNILWPALGISIVVLPLVYLLRRKIGRESIVSIFTFIYFLFINTRLFFPRYLVLILPFLYVLLLWEITLIVQRVKKTPHP